MPLSPTGMRMRALGVASLISVSLLSGGSAAAAGFDFPTNLTPPATGASATPASTLVPGEVTVRFDDPSEASSRVRAWGAEISLRIGLPGLVTAKFDDSVDTVALAKDIASRPGIRWAEPNRTMETQATSNDPRVGELWGMNNTGQSIRGITGLNDVDANIFEAWDTITGGDAVVAVGDSGVAINHPDLADNIWTNPGETGTDAQGRDKKTNGLDDDGNSKIDDWRGWDFINNDNDPSDEQGHGTHVAGTIGAVGNNGQGIAGVSHRVKIMPLKIGSNSRTDTSINSDAAAAAMLYAASKGVKIFNGSFGGSSPSKAQEDAIAASQNTLFVFAAGNSKSDNDGATPSYPCNFNRANILCVASIANNGSISNFSNFGVKSVDLGAPGSEILSVSPFTFLVDDPFEQPIADRWTVKTAVGPNPGWGIFPNSDGTNALGINFPNGVPANSDSILVSKRVNLATCVDPVFEVDLGAVFTNGSVQLIVSDSASDVDTAGWGLIGSTSSRQIEPIQTDLSSVTTNNGPKNYDGKQVFFIIRVQTGAGNTGLGPFLDNLKVSCKPNVFTGQEFEYKSGTSMASPLVAGAAGLVLNQFPGADMNYLRSAILGSVTPMPSLAGKTVTGGRLNVAAALDREGPAAFGLAGPGAGASTADPRPAFSWNGTTDAKTGVARYELFVDGQNVGGTDGNGRSAQPANALSVGGHNWRVDAVDGAGQRTSSETRPITIVSPVPPGPPLKIGKFKKLTKASIAKSGFAIPCEIGVKGRCRVAVRLSRDDAKKLKLKISKKATTFLVAKGSAKVGKSGKATVKIKPTKAIGSAIKKGKKKVTFKIEVIGVDEQNRETVQNIDVRA